MPAKQLNIKAKTGERMRKASAIALAIGAVLFLALLFWLHKEGYFSDTRRLQDWIAGTGLWGPILFVLISISQGFFPVVPFGAMSAIGLVLFGPLLGFILNGIVSIACNFMAFMLTRRYGHKVILLFSSPEIYEKMSAFLKKWTHFDWIFIGLMLLPVTPDLLISMIAGLTTMSWKKALLILCCTRPFSTWIYSTVLLKLFQHVEKALPR